MARNKKEYIGHGGTGRVYSGIIVAQNAAGGECKFHQKKKFHFSQNAQK